VRNCFETNDDDGNCYGNYGVTASDEANEGTVYVNLLIVTKKKK
jgi:hypothetical protein